ncbi:MAG TPA: 2-hydroxychromene-2-carboxylate isomerase [Stellaceae bacterium]|nr:2-hydroxychromene-2-carboxylate isomerase [Stellaceae bacterium]
MARVVEFYFDYGSPFSYVAHWRLPEMLRRVGGEARHRIMLLGGVFQATGNQSPAMNPLKWPNSQRDLERHVGKYQVPFRRNPHFPVNTLKAMRGAVVAESQGFLPRYTDAMFTAMWRDGEKLDDDAVLARVLGAAGIDAARVLSRIAEDGVKQTLKSHTEAAVRRGVFGAPTFFVGGEMFFGQDRLDFVEDALKGRSYLSKAEPAA